MRRLLLGTSALLILIEDEGEADLRNALVKQLSRWLIDETEEPS